jgi:diguanylate cyclase (GGDEF)-like protein/PAS domain S-box-containing protein
MPPQALFPHARRQSGRSALAVVLLYACFAALWILLSDHVLELLFSDPQALLLASTVKGWIFVAVTSLLLYGLLRRRAGTPKPPQAHIAAGGRLPAAATLLLLGLLVSGVVTAAIWHSLRQQRELAEAQLLAISQSKARELAQWLQERLRDAHWLQGSLALEQSWLRWRSQGHGSDAATLRQLLAARFLYDDLYARADIVDAQGLRWFSSQPALGAPVGDGSAAPPAVEPALHQAVRQALMQAAPQRLGPWRDDEGRLWLSIVAPLATSSPWPAAVMLHHPIAGVLHPTLADWPLPQHSAELVLFRVEDDAVLMLSALRHDAAAALQRRIPLQRTDVLSVRLASGLAPAGRLIEGADYRGRPSYGMGQRIDGTDWWLLAKQDRAELLHAAMIDSAWMVLTAMLALLAVGGALYLHIERRRLVDSQRELEALRAIEHNLRQSEAYYRLLTESTTDVVWLYDLEQDRYAYASPSVQQQLGYSQLEMQGLRIEDLVVPEQAAAVRAAMQQRLQAFAAGNAQVRTSTDEITVRHKDGHAVPLEIVSTLLPDAQERVSRILGIARDISARKHAEAQLRQLSQAIEQSPSAVLITDLQGRIEYVNPAFERISGYTREEVLGRKPSLLGSGRTPREVYAQLWATIREGGTWGGEIVNRRKDGAEYVQSMSIAPVRDARGQPTHYLAVQMDVTAQREAERRAHQLAWYSQLTGLPNRHRLLVELDDAQHQRARTGREAMLLLLNLDRFQTVNDALGHTAGDELLRQVGNRLAALVQGNDTLAHLSADEFALLLHGYGDREVASSHALRLASQIHARLDEPFDLGTRTGIQISCCIGVTPVWLHAGDNPGEALRRADTALHRAKSLGTGQTALFDASMEALIRRRFAIEQDLRRGLAAGELRLYLQPQVTAHGDIAAAEALLRWQHPQQGLLAPGQFIPVAEESELIVELGRWVLGAACALLGQLHQLGRRLPIAVNISPRHFHQPDFVAEVQQTLQSHMAQAQDLVIEITEGTLLEHSDSVVQKMAALHALGVRFSLDDFGTGYSSLAYLKRLPIDEIKIDRSFVQDAPNDPNDAALVEAMLSVARHLRLRVVAEGVETREQADFLNARAEVLQQGYLHGRPQPAQELIARWLGRPG